MNRKMTPSLSPAEQTFLRQSARFQNVILRLLLALGFIPVLGYMVLLDRHPNWIDWRWHLESAGYCLLLLITAAFSWREQAYLRLIAQLQQKLVHEQLKQSDLNLEQLQRRPSDLNART